MSCNNLGIAGVCIMFLIPALKSLSLGLVMSSFYLCFGSLVIKTIFISRL